MRLMARHKSNPPSSRKGRSLPRPPRRQLAPYEVLHAVAIFRRAVAERFGEKEPSDRALARAMGVSSYTVNLLRNADKHPERGLGIDMILTLSDFTRVGIDELLGRPVPRERST